MNHWLKKKVMNSMIIHSNQKDFILYLLKIKKVNNLKKKLKITLKLRI